MVYHPVGSADNVPAFSFLLVLCLSAWWVISLRANWVGRGYPRLPFPLVIFLVGDEVSQHDSYQ